MKLSSEEREKYDDMSCRWKTVVHPNITHYYSEDITVERLLNEDQK